MWLFSPLSSLFFVPTVLSEKHLRYGNELNGKVLPRGHLQPAPTGTARGAHTWAGSRVPSAASEHLLGLERGKRDGNRRQNPVVVQNNLQQ